MRRFIDTRSRKLSKQWFFRAFLHIIADRSDLNLMCTPKNKSWLQAKIAIKTIDTFAVSVTLDPKKITSYSKLSPFNFAIIIDSIGRKVGVKSQ